MNEADSYIVTIGADRSVPPETGKQKVCIAASEEDAEKEEDS